MRDLKEIKLSYSVLNDLECPYKYYKIYIEKIDRPLDISAVIGTVTHKIYEEVIDKYILNPETKDKPNRFFEHIYNDYIHSLLFQNIEQYIQSGFFLKSSFNVINVIREIKVSLSEDFLNILWKFKHNYGFEIKSELKLTSKHELLGMNVIGIPDIFMYKNDKLIIIDIKTSKFSYSNFNKQAIIYSFLINSFKDNFNFTDISNFIFITKFNKMVLINRYNNINDIITAFDNITSNLVYIYKNLFGADTIDINTIEFIYKNIENRDKETLDIIKSYITKETCKFCILKKNCPILNSP